MAYGNLEVIRERLGAVLTDLSVQATAGDAPADTAADSLIAVCGQLFDVMQRVESDHPRAHSGGQGLQTENGVPTTISDLGDYALALVEEARRRMQPADAAQAEQITELVLEFTAWTIRHGGEIRMLEPVVDSLAASANRTADVVQLTKLAELAFAVAERAAAHYQQDLEQGNPGRPWRLLHMNLGIMATRSRRPDLMEKAFARLARHLPNDAALFFQQGMQQVKLSDYPDSVRSVMTKYFSQWSNKPALH